MSKYIVRRLTADDASEKFYVFRVGSDLTVRRKSLAVFSDYADAKAFIERKQAPKTFHRWV